MFKLAFNLVILITSILAQEWKPPYFLENVDVSENVTSLTETPEGTVIFMNENIMEDIIIVFFNYNGATEPVISKFIEPVNSAASQLGAKITRTESKSNWELIITVPQDYETKPKKYSFEITVGDTKHKVHLHINNLDDETPFIEINADNNPCKIDENYKGPTGCFYKISDLDGIMSNTVIYNLAGSVPNVNQIFEIRNRQELENGMKEWTAELNVLKELDFEQLPSYILDFTVIDSGQNSYTVKIVVEVQDLPDTPPVWRKIFSSARFPEKEQKIFEVIATDGDIGINDKIFYDISSDWPDLFKIDGETGIITIEKIDRDALKMELFLFEVIAYEEKNNAMAINQNVTIVIDDINDHIPEITMDVLDVTIPENTLLTLNVKIETSDIDLGNNAKYKVSFVPNTYSKAFQIVPGNAYQTGSFSISVVDNSVLDYEDPDLRVVELTIRSEEDYDITHYDEITLTVHLENWNDELPIFNQSEYTVLVSEDVGKDVEIVTVLAGDKDVDDFVTYSLIGTEIQRLFSIDNSSGVIKTKIDNVLDYERQTVVFIQVQVKDNLGEPYHIAVAPLTINVIDVNDETPTIRMGSELISVDENRENGTPINSLTDILGFDPDTDADLKFSIDWTMSKAVKNGQSVLSFDEWIYVETEFDTEGRTWKALLKVNEVTPHSTPDYEIFDTMYLQLQVTDLNQVIGTSFSIVQVTIAIQDLNDNSPEFIKETVDSVKNVIEGDVNNTRVGVVTAIDRDGPNHNKIVYSLRPNQDETPSDWVNIDPNNGELSVVGNIDPDEYCIYNLYYTVTATNEDLITDANITIGVIDRNTKIPSCTFKDEVKITEKSESGTIVSEQNIVCKDDDRDEQYNTPWFRISSPATDVKNVFSINTSTGIVYVDLKGENELNRDEGMPIYTFPFIVSDNYYGTPQNIKEYSFKITLVDINDHAPIIQTTDIDGKENMKKNYALGEIFAKDIDESNTPNTQVNFEILNVTKGPDSGAVPPSDLFRIEVEDEFSGKGKLIANYDLQTYYGTYVASIKAFDYGVSPGPQSSTKDVHVNIDKYNFKPPKFVYPSEEDNEPIYLGKKQEIGKPVRKHDGSILQPFKATDQQGDKWDIHITIDEATNPDGIFDLHKLEAAPSEANLILNSIPNFSGTYEIKLIADCKCVGDEPFDSSITVRIRFVDSDSEPEFEDNNITLEFLENDVSTTQQLPKAYFNKEGEDWDVFDIYYFLTKDETNSFEVDKTSAELKIVKPLDREQTSSLNLAVVASKNANGNMNPSNYSVLDVLINVKDVNDEVPQFNKTEFYAGIKSSNSLNSVILLISAFDLDIDDELNFILLPETLEAHGNAINAIKNPFYISSENEVLNGHIIGSGKLFLNFAVQNNMNGYFTFTVKVVDQANHEAQAPVKIYIVSDSSKVIVQFANNIDTVISKQETIRIAFEENVGYRCNIEEIVTSSEPETGEPIPDQTDVVTHFVDDETNEAVDSIYIQQTLSSVKVFTQLSSQLIEEGLYLLNFNNVAAPENNEEVLMAWLIGVSVVLGTLCVALIMAFVLKTRSLNSRLQKLSAPKFGSQESGLNRLGLVAPNTNKHAIEGSNPVYSEEKQAPEMHRYSVSSGDSDLIGVEDNPNFDYNYDTKEKDVGNQFKNNF